MDFTTATQLQAKIVDQSKSGEIAPDVSTRLESDEIMTLNGKQEMWRVIVEWPQHLIRPISSEEQWEHRKSDFAEWRTYHISLYSLDGVEEASASVVGLPALLKQVFRWGEAQKTATERTTFTVIQEDVVQKG